MHIHRTSCWSAFSRKSTRKRWASRLRTWTVWQPRRASHSFHLAWPTTQTHLQSKIYRLAKLILNFGGTSSAGADNDADGRRAKVRPSRPHRLNTQAHYFADRKMAAHKTDLPLSPPSPSFPPTRPASCLRHSRPAASADQTSADLVPWDAHDRQSGTFIRSFCGVARCNC